ncbi:39S mitochondrial ribosomal protein L46-domain-containing protein [Chaetomium tenue]|uniref:39S mitochondrial ribosomal protein L46-domain-containing protein n=1 Tax=Chaetomium tenue TaxID=1854479 RepID=A0ACB7PAS1_9PEZI|nr:39S mitochondrial ribosomal protein L46-domain-containing protein [Chaetomium globosum]
MMSAPGRGSALLRGSYRVCTQCARPAPRPRIATTTRTTPRASAVLPLASRRYYSAEPATAQQTPTTPESTPTPPTTTTITPSTDPNPETALYLIKSSLILTRPPLLTREQTPFESAFYFYQKRLNERLTAPFRRQFYFKQDTAADLDFRIKLAERHGVPAKDIGRYNPRGRMAWNDELLTGSTTSDPAELVNKLLADAEVRVSEDGEPIAPEERVPVERPAPRRSEADEKGDVRRLDRAMERTLYLVVRREWEEVVEGVKKKEAVWEFPTGLVQTQETLHEAAARVITESAGVNMNTWVVGRVPVAHHVVKPVVDEAGGTTVVDRGTKTFFLKGRIMTGQADLAGNKHGLTDFKWLTREELQEVLPEEYYRSVRGMMDLR